MIENNTKYILKQYPGGWAICGEPYWLFGDKIEPLYRSFKDIELAKAYLNRSGCKYTVKYMENYPYS